MDTPEYTMDTTHHSTKAENSSRFVNPFTDFGFKRLFGEEANKELMIDFLNELVKPHHKIVDLTFKNVEKSGSIKTERRAAYDIFCKNQNEETFIVEMQKAFQNFFKDRMVFYSTFPIREQAKKGESWNFELKTVYCIGILDFEFKDELVFSEYEEEPSEEIKEKVKADFHRHIVLKDQYNCIFYPKLIFKTLEMPKFKKKESELLTHFDKWIYFIKNLTRFDSIPEILKEPIFERAFDVAEVANFNQKEMEEYEQSLKIYWDINNVIDSSFRQGVEAEQKKTREAENRAEQIKKEKEQIEKEKEQIEKEKEQIEKEKGQIEKEKGQIEEQLKNSILKAIKRGKLSTQEIAEDFGVSVESIYKISGK